MQSPVSLSATLLSPTKALAHALPPARNEENKDSPERKVYVHVIQKSGYNPKTASGASVKISGVDSELIVREGDGAYVIGAARSELKFENTGESVSEILLFDVE